MDLWGKILGAGGGFPILCKSSKIKNFKKAFKNYSIIDLNLKTGLT